MKMPCSRYRPSHLSSSPQSYPESSTSRLAPVLLSESLIVTVPRSSIFLASPPHCSLSGESKMYSESLISSLPSLKHFDGSSVLDRIKVKVLVVTCREPHNLEPSGSDPILPLSILHCSSHTEFLVARMCCLLVYRYDFFQAVLSIWHFPVLLLLPHPWKTLHTD